MVAGAALYIARAAHDEWRWQGARYDLLRSLKAGFSLAYSIAGFESYRGGAGYIAAKHGQRSMLRNLRLELLGEPVRVTEVAPGVVETEFSLVRFGGDEEAAKRVYRGITPLTAENVGECIRWAVAQPAHVNVDEIILRPRDQAAAAEVHRA